MTQVLMKPPLFAALRFPQRERHDAVTAPLPALLQTRGAMSDPDKKKARKRAKKSQRLQVAKALEESGRHEREKKRKKAKPRTKGKS